MQITFNVPPALQRDLEWLAAKQGSSVEALMYVTAFQGFGKELRQKMDAERLREASEKPFRSEPKPINWHERVRPAPINWKGGGIR